MKILLTQTAFLGDVVLATPVIQRLHEKYPEAELHLLTTEIGKGLFPCDPRLHTVHTFPKRSGRFGVRETLGLAKTLRALRFDKLYSLHRSPRSSILHLLSGIPERVGFSDASFSLAYNKRVKRKKGGHAVQRNLSLLGEDEKIPLSLYPIKDEDVSSELRDFVRNSDRMAVVVPGSVWTTKRWHWSNYRRLVTMLSESGVTVALGGNSSEKDLCEEVGEGIEGVTNWAGRLNIEEFVWMMKNTDTVFCNDSFALHVASAFQKQTVAVFCATSPEFGFGPWQNPNATVVEKVGLWCKPCRRHGSMVCPTGTELCMRSVSADEVYDSYKGSL